MSDLRQHLEGVRAKHGVLTPATVVAEASDPKHPLHERFEWRDDEAAVKWRLHQAGELIRSVRVSYRNVAGQPRDVRAFLAVKMSTGAVYEDVETVVQDPLLSRIALADMEREWKAFKARWEYLSEFADMIRKDVA